jgi:hypothetical protein
MHRAVRSLAVAIVVFVLGAAPASAAPGWGPASKVLDIALSQPSMVVDDQGHEHIAARGETGIWYLTDLNGMGTWTRVRLTRDFTNQYGDRVTASAPRIALDRDRDRLVVVYTRTIGMDTPSTTDVRFITFPVAPHGLDASSRSRPIPGISSAASVVMRDGVLAVVGEAGLYDSTTVRFVTNATGRWTTAELGPERVGGPTDPSLALDRDGHAVIAYVTDPPPAGDPMIRLAHATTTTGGFHSTRVAAGAAPSLVLDSHDRPLLAFTRAASTVFARRHHDGWHHAPVLPAAVAVELRVDRHGRPHIIAASHGPGPGLWYATRRAGAWQRVRLDARMPSVVSLGTALQRRWSGGPIHVVYQLGQRVWHIQSS